MSSRKHGVVVIPLLLYVSGSVLMGQNVKSGSSQTGEMTSVRRDFTDNSYIIAYTSAGETTEFRFVPATLTVPSITSTVTQDSASNTFLYSYEFANGPGAMQELHSVSIRALSGFSVAETADGWEAMPTQAVSRIMWYLRPVGSRRLGISPGSAQRGFAIQSPHLPGPSEARCVGNVAAPSFSTSVPEAVRKELQILQKTDYLVVNVLSPVIPFGNNEPELTAAVLVSRIRAAYERALLTSKHPRRVEINDGIWKAVSLFSDGHNKPAREEVANVQRLAGAAKDGWPGTLGRGLSMALEAALRRFPE